MNSERIKCPEQERIISDDFVVQFAMYRYKKEKETIRVKKKEEASFNAAATSEISKNAPCSFGENFAQRARVNVVPRFHRGITRTISAERLCYTLTRLYRNLESSYYAPRWEYAWRESAAV